MKKIEVIVEQEMINYLQRLNFEVYTREEIITKLLETHKDDVVHITHWVYISFQLLI